jgi:hypothetical protein
MSKLTVILAALIACLGISALASASASAACVSGEWCVEGTALGSGSNANLAKKATTVKDSELTADGITITCTTLEGSEPKIEGPASGSAKALIFTGCAANANCEVAKELKTNAVVAAVSTVGALEASAVFKPAAGSSASFITIDFKGSSCALSGNKGVKGTLLLMAPEGQMESKKQLVVANSSGELEVGTEPATFKGEAEFELESGKAWSFF